MKPIHVASVAAALVLAACAGSEKELTGPQKAAAEAHEQAQKTQEKAEEAHEEAMKAQKDLADSEQADEDARRAQIAADKQADEAAVQAQKAERQANMAAPQPQQRTAGQAAQKGVAEAQGSQPAAPKVIVITAGLLFPTGSAELSPAAKPKLDEVAGALHSQPQANNVVVTGYTDDTGDSKGNLKLSEQRAHAVADYLASQGIPKERITTKGLGMKNPIGNESTADDRAMNRRVDIDVKAVAPSSGQASPQKTP